jgi:hypothetical protein
MDLTPLDEATLMAEVNAEIARAAENARRRELVLDPVQTRALVAMRSSGMPWPGILAASADYTHRARPASGKFSWSYHYPEALLKALPAEVPAPVVAALAALAVPVPQPSVGGDFRPFFFDEEAA